MPGTLYIVAAPSGAGKTSLTRALLEQEPGIALSVSYTSRAPQPTKISFVHYQPIPCRLSPKMIRRDEFFDYPVEVCAN